MPVIFPQYFTFLPGTEKQISINNQRNLHHLLGIVLLSFRLGNLIRWKKRLIKDGAAECIRRSHSLHAQWDDTHSRHSPWVDFKCKFIYSPSCSLTAWELRASWEFSENRHRRARSLPCQWNTSFWVVCFVLITCCCAATESGAA